ncbi:MAG: MgtC/SapB family protein [Thiomonas sp.]
MTPQDHGLTTMGVHWLAAFVLGGLIGVERQYRQRTAGLRTNVLVALGAAVFVGLAGRIEQAAGAVHVLAYVVSGIGFLGAGVIMREEGNVRGLNTAATLWGSAAVGACCGAGLLPEAGLAAAYVLAANTLLRPMVNFISRQPVDTSGVELTVNVVLIAQREFQKDARAMLENLLELAHYPHQDMDVHPFGAQDVEIEVRLLANSVDPEELDRITQQLSSLPYVRQAFWSSSATE